MKVMIKIIQISLSVQTQVLYDSGTEIKIEVSFIILNSWKTFEYEMAVADSDSLFVSTHPSPPKKGYKDEPSSCSSPSLTDKTYVTFSSICCSSHMSDVDSSLSPLRGRRKKMEHLAVLQQSRYMKYFIQYPSCCGRARKALYHSLIS